MLLKSKNKDLYKVPKITKYGESVLNKASFPSTSYDRTMIIKIQDTLD